MAKERIWVFLRIFLGFIFLWAFLDKLFGLGFSTARDKSWLIGASPTSGFLQNAVHGPFASVFQSLSGSAFIDWLFMLGLLLLGIALIFGVALRLAGYSGSLLMILMWLSLLPPENNPIIDDHIIYSLVLIGIATVKPYWGFGLGKLWYNSNFIKKNKFLE